MQEVYCDLAENLNPVNGYSHLLIVTCPLSDFTLIIPLKSKTSAEVNQYMLYAILQPFKIEVIHSDNGPAFRSLGFLEIMSALGITVINSSSLSPRGRGIVKKKVYVVKKLLQKMLATRPTLSWKYLPFLVSKALNNAISPKTGFKPAEMVLGAEAAGNSFLDLSKMAPPHYSVKSNKLHMEQLSKEFKTLTEIATKNITELRIVQNERVNKNRVERTFKINDIVFVLDRTYVEGNPRVLRTTLNPSPYVVLKPLFKSSLVMRLADRFTSLYNNEDMKLFQGNSPLFQNLPPPVLRALLYKFADFMESEFTTITKLDSLKIPNSIVLFNSDFSEEQKPSTDNNIDLFSEVDTPLNEVNVPTPNSRDENQQNDVPLEEQDFDDFPENDELEKDIEELVSSEQKVRPNQSDQPDDQSEDESEDDEPGMRLRSGNVKTQAKRVTFQ